MPNSWFAKNAGGQSPYVRVERTENSVVLREPRPVVLKVFPTGIANVTAAIVTPEVLDIEEGDTKSVRFTPMSMGEYRRHWLLGTWPGKLTAVGLAFVVVGQIINISLEIGKEWVAIDVGADGIAAAKASVGVLTLVGAVLAAWQGLLKA